MKRKFLEDLGLEKEVIDKILDENSADIGKEKKLIEDAQKERDDIQARLDDVQTKLTEFEGVDVTQLKEEIGNLKQDLENKDVAHKEEMAAKDYGYAITSAVEGVKFSSAAAKKAFVSDLKEKGLKFENDALLGFDDYVNECKKADPGAFAEEEADAPPYAAGTGSKPLTGEEKTEFEKRLEKYRRK